jgi:proline dehydrogenase
LNAKGITVSLDLLGESVTIADETHGARDGVLQALDAIADAGVAGNVSVKLTQMGLDIDEGLCAANMHAILARARDLDTFVRIDMEASAYVERTLRLFREDLFPTFGDLVGVVIQSYLRRSAEDVDTLIGMGARVRLCKGAYAEPATVAFHGKKAVKTSYIALMRRLLDDGKYPAIATHDPDLINQAVRYAQARDIPPARFEFQMLYGVRRDLQERLRADGYNVRVYIPFGTNWYPYLMRRLGERPGNVTFMVASILKEGLSRP